MQGPIPPLPVAEVDIEKLVGFFRAPQRAFVRDRLRVRLPQESEQTDDREPTSLDALERYKLNDRLLKELRTKERDTQARVLTLEGKLPPGTPGRVVFEDLENTIRSMLAEVDVGGPLPNLRLAIDTPHGRIVGTLSSLYEHARVELTAATLAPKHKLSAWIRHLALCASDGPCQETLLVGKPEKGGGVATVAMGPVQRAKELLGQLLVLYKLGQQMPLPFIVAKSSKYAEAYVDKKDEAVCLAKAKDGESRPGFTDSAERYQRQVWSEQELEELEHLVARGVEGQVDFVSVAQTVLVPMLEHLKEQKEVEA